MDPAVGIGHLLTAGFLGVTHGIEPDHIAGITALTHEAADPKLSGLVGGCFAVGHAVLVILWITVVHLVFGGHFSPGVFEEVGLLFVGIILSVLSLSLGVMGTRKLLHRHEHDHNDSPHSHYHVHLLGLVHSSGVGHGRHAHEHGAGEYLKVGTVGALFTLSPPVSMIAFVSITMAAGNLVLLTGVVAVYTLVITVTMVLVGVGAGSVFHFSKATGEHFYALSQVVASVLVLLLAVKLLSNAISGLPI